MFGKTLIKDSERGLLYRNGRFQRVLAPGAYRFWSHLWSAQRDRIEIVDVSKTEFEHPELEVLARLPAIDELTEVVDLGENQRGLVWWGDQLLDIVGPGLHVYWKVLRPIRVERFVVDDLIFNHESLPQVIAHRSADRWINAIRVEPYQTLVLLREGEILAGLRRGLVALWRTAGAVKTVVVDGRERTSEVQGQEILTADRVTLRLNMTLTWRVVDAALSVSTAQDVDQAIYREAQQALRAAVGTRSLDALLEDKEALGQEIEAALSARSAQLGVAIASLGVKDIILPGDMKLIMNQVIVARKEAEANVIRRREETAAARSQANTAKLVAENPVLARMKELEAMQDILRGSNVSFVLGSGSLTEQIRGQLTRLVEDA